MIEYGPVPPHVAAAKATVAQWLSDEDAAIRAAQNRGPSAADRFDAIRTAQAAAAAEGRTLPVPPTPAQLRAVSLEDDLTRALGVARDVQSPKSACKNLCHDAAHPRKVLRAPSLDRADEFLNGD